jgi:hypothetical protein
MYDEQELTVVRANLYSTACIFILRIEMSLSVTSPLAEVLSPHYTCRLS